MINQWPFVVATVVMAAAGICQIFFRRVPNILTLMSLGVALIVCWATPSPLRATGLALLCAACSLVAMIPAYGKELAAGSIKAQMAFSAWLGVGMSFSEGSGVYLTLACVIVAYGFLLICVRLLARQGTLTYEVPDKSQPRGIQRMFHAQLPLSLANVVCVIGYLLKP